MVRGNGAWHQENGGYSTRSFTQRDRGSLFNNEADISNEVAERLPLKSNTMDGDRDCDIAQVNTA